MGLAQKVGEKVAGFVATKAVDKTLQQKTGEEKPSKLKSIGNFFKFWKKSESTPQQPTTIPAQQYHPQQTPVGQHQPQQYYYPPTPNNNSTRNPSSININTNAININGANINNNSGANVNNSNGNNRGGGSGGGNNNTDDAQLKAARDGGKGIGGKGDDSPKKKVKIDKAGAFLFFAIIILLIDGLMHFARPNLFIIGCYVVYVFFGLVLVYKDNLSASKGFLGSIALSYGLPFLAKLSFFQQQSNTLSGIRPVDALSFLLFFFPCTILFLMFQLPEGSKLRSFAFWWIMIWVLIGIIILLFTFGTQLDNTQTSSIKNPVEGVLVVLKKIFLGLGTSYQNMVESVKKNINHATGADTVGTEESQRGIYLKDFKPDSRTGTYNLEMPVYIDGKIEAQNIPQQVEIDLKCYAKGNNYLGSTTYQGAIQPQKTKMSKGDQDYIQCKIDNPKEVGYYDVTIEGMLNYETDAEVTYYFINRKNQQLIYDGKITDVPDKPTVTYTGGPVMLQMADIAQPLKVDFEAINEFNYGFAIKLEPKWGDGGEVLQGKMYVVSIPKMFKLAECSRTPTTPRSDGGRTIYTFQIDTAEVKDTFDQISCRLIAADTNAITAALTQDVVSKQTFSVNATYIYRVKQTSQFTIQNDSGQR